MREAYNQVVLILLSGWGVAPPHESNVLSQAELPQFRKLMKEYPTSLLKPVNFEPDILSFKYTSPELASLSLGTGKNHFQVISWVDKLIGAPDFYDNRILKNALEQARGNNSNVHLVGLLGEGRINSSQKHLYSLLNFLVKNNFKDVFIHGILDGEDESKQAGLGYLQALSAKLKELNLGQIASLSGRYYGMDRGGHWERTFEAYKALLGLAGKTDLSPMEYLENNYQKDVYDFDVKPVCFSEGVKMQDKDVVLFFNSRPDYIRQLAESLSLPSFAKFERSFDPRNLFVATLTEYEKEFPAEVILKENFIDYSLSKILSENNLKQVKISEVDKYPHTSYHFNGLSEEPFSNEEWKLVAHKEVGEYGKKTLVEKLGFEAVKYIDRDDYNFIIVDFSSADLKAREGDFESIKQEAEKIDKALGRVVDYCLARDAVAIITSDCGNIEQMLDIKTGLKDIGPNNNPLPFILVANEFRGLAGPTGDPLESDLSFLRPVGSLSVVAPTVLKLFGIKKPDAMSGDSII